MVVYNVSQSLLVKKMPSSTPWRTLSALVLMAAISALLASAEEDSDKGAYVHIDHLA